MAAKLYKRICTTNSTGTLIIASFFSSEALMLPAKHKTQTTLLRLFPTVFETVVAVLLPDLFFMY